MLTTKKYKPYSLRNFRDIPQIAALSEQEKFNIEVVGNVFPFKTNNYVVEELIDWSKVPNDPIYVLNFPQKDMLKPGHFDRIAELIKSGSDRKGIRATADDVRTGECAQKSKKHITRDSQNVQRTIRTNTLLMPTRASTKRCRCALPHQHNVRSLNMNLLRHTRRMD